jgi:hypothetical protein
VEIGSNLKIARGSENNGRSPRDANGDVSGSSAAQKAEKRGRKLEDSSLGMLIAGLQQDCSTKISISHQYKFQLSNLSASAVFGRVDFGGPRMIARGKVSQKQFPKTPSRIAGDPRGKFSAK